MKKKIIGGFVAATILWAVVPSASIALSTATVPKLTPVASILPRYEVRTTVTLDTEVEVVVTSEAYRHPIEVEYRKVLPAGTHAIAVRCTSTRLPHDWKVYIGGVRVTQASLKCE